LDQGEVTGRDSGNGPTGPLESGSDSWDGCRLWVKTSDNIESRRLKTGIKELKSTTTKAEDSDTNGRLGRSVWQIRIEK
jgi:hypothetical protein